jgi:hypothetical protein
MSRNTRMMQCTPQDVFAVLSDGWSYANWVVGAARIRDVDAGWPSVGTRIHHSVGLWPLLISDNTEVEHVDAPHELRLKVRLWPTGSGIVTMSCAAKDGGTEVTMEEQLVSGPAALLPRPVKDAMLHARNVEALNRLAYLAENREHRQHHD